MKKKRCSICKKYKLLDKFYLQNRIKNKYMSACKSCFAKRTKELRQQNIQHIHKRDRKYYQDNKKVFLKRVKKYRDNNRIKLREYELKTNYNLTLKQYNRILKKQNFCCAICKVPQKDYFRAFCVDHKHRTEKIRGLLCNGCNRGLGFYEKNKTKYEIYLKKCK